jgi:2-succinyl-6-hydroxy-2,4-cyclohexadiene-1-carboxylate synthase
VEVDVDIDALLSHVGRAIPRGSVLVGYSLGARYAAHLADRRACEPSALVLVGVHPGLSGDARRTRAEDDAALAGSFDERSLEESIARWEALPLFASQAAMPANARAERRALRAMNRREGLAWSLRNQGLASWPSTFRAVERLRIPVHVVVGEHDLRYCELSREFAGLRHVTIHRVAGAGHDVAFERPDAVAQIVTLAALGRESERPARTERNEIHASAE